MLRRGSVYYVLQASVYGCCFCPQGSNVITWQASSPLGPFKSDGNINQCVSQLCPGSSVANGGLCLGAQGVPRCKGPGPAPAPTPVPPSHTLAIGHIYGQLSGGEKLCLAPNSSAACVPHGRELPPSATCHVRIEACIPGLAEQQWRVTSAGELVSNVTGACMDGGHGTVSKAVYANFCVRSASNPAPIGQTWSASSSSSSHRGSAATSTFGELRNVAAGTCVALPTAPAQSVEMEPCKTPGVTDGVWHLPSVGKRLEAVHGGYAGRGRSSAQVWEVPSQQQGVTAVPLRLATPIDGCDGDVMMWSGDAWQQAPDGRKEHDPQWWVPLCFGPGGIQNLSAVRRWDVTLV